MVSTDSTYKKFLISHYRLGGKAGLVLVFVRSFFMVNKDIKHTLIFKKLGLAMVVIWGGKPNHTSSFFSFNLSFTLKICFEREMERAKLMTAFPSLIFPVSEQCAPISSLACQDVGNVALIK